MGEVRLPKDWEGTRAWSTVGQAQVYAQGPGVLVEQLAAVWEGESERMGAALSLGHHKDRTQEVINSYTHLFHIINTHYIQNNVIKCRNVSASDS